MFKQERKIHRERRGAGCCLSSVSGKLHFSGLDKLPRKEFSHGWLRTLDW